MQRQLTTCIYSVYFIFWIALLFLMFQSCRELVVSTLQIKTCFQDFSLSIITTDDHIDRIISQTVYVMKKLIISISIQSKINHCLKNELT